MKHLYKSRKIKKDAFNFVRGGGEAGAGRPVENGM